VQGWFEAQPARPADVPAADWLSFEQDKHQRLLAAAARPLTQLETR
jgi:MerR family copper efflux transcriptional regulator